MESSSHHDGSALDNLQDLNREISMLASKIASNEQTLRNQYCEKISRLEALEQQYLAVITAVSGSGGMVTGNKENKDDVKDNTDSCGMISSNQEKCCSGEELIDSTNNKIKVRCANCHELVYPSSTKDAFILFPKLNSQIIDQSKTSTSKSPTNPRSTSSPLKLPIPDDLKQKLMDHLSWQTNQRLKGLSPQEPSKSLVPQVPFKGSNSQQQQQQQSALENKKPQGETWKTRYSNRNASNGHQKSKKFCSYCHKPGHSRAQCPERFE
ncbi:hypothetical protein DASC09_048910 [Saccharomycopsis crataegensis]|uniref:CCHC-type domain-containing protein n=1 Tax=Saccharomycopsis crataegensis TaxID=43959 RepID=A0AAV5QSQ7_9ASCO|nr:hypothetical protein DASC09_048910 [Saccharomycopsis crataegensis]